MCLLSCLCDYFDPLKAKDEDQKKYREAFGITDRYLLNYELSDNGEGFIVFIDREYDIDWADKNYLDKWTPDEKKTFYETIGRLDAAQTYPCEILNCRKKLNFKRRLGVGYVNAFHKNFNNIEELILSATNYVEERCKETARTIFLTVATICICCCAAVFFFQKFNFINLPWNLNYTAAICCGMAGSYVSIWSRFNELKMKGLSSKWALWVESLSRLFIGCISGIIVIMFFKTDIILTILKDKEPLFSYSIIAFVAGFYERWLTSIVEHFVNTQDKK